MENRIKEQLMLFSDRTSTAYLRSNQLRLYFSSLAYVLLQSLRRLGLEGTELAQAQCATLRLKLLKIGALSRITVRKYGSRSQGDTPMPNYSGRFMPSSLPYRLRAEPAGFAKMFLLVLCPTVRGFPPRRPKAKPLPYPRASATRLHLANTLVTTDFYLASVLRLLW